ncbi:MAG: hypothetical protein JRI97_11755 [Deltaproteobacteria bacterium]|nr:hypothetical protein [Deltaproteobacteria bacterium]
MGYIKDERPTTMMVGGSWNIGAYKYKANGLLDEYLEGLKEKKLIGSMCMGCGKVIVPPRLVCGRCHREMTERVVVSDKGTVTTFVVSPPIEKGKVKAMGMDAVELGLFTEGEVIMPAYVQFDGADCNLNLLILDADPKDVCVGMRVEAVWAENPVGALSDIEGVRPIPMECGGLDENQKKG